MSHTNIDIGRRQYLFCHTNGTYEAFTATAQYRDGEVTLTDVQDHRWITEPQPQPHWVDLIHDGTWNGEDE